MSYQSIKAILPLGGRSALVLMGRGTLHRTDDGGQTWAVVGRAPEIDTVGVFATNGVIGPDRRLYVAVTRAGCCVQEFAYRTAQPVVVASEPAPAPVGSGLTLRAEPNPSAGAVALVLTLPTTEARVRVAVYDGLGREVAVAHEGALAAGEHRLSLQTGGLAPGVYVARAVTGGGAVTARLALTR